jgi:hypothetical protein
MSRSPRTAPRRSTALTAPVTAVRVLLTAALGAVLVFAGLTAPATAHGGDIVISLGTDGAGGVSANLTYKIDGHPVEEAADVSVTAESDAGETVGPIALRSASEGVGWYVSDPGVLAEGHWVLTATMTDPSEATASAEVDVVPPAEPPAPAEGDGSAADAADGDATEGSTAGSDAAADPGEGDGASSSGSGPLLWVLLAAAVVAVGALGVVVARRRARSLTSTSTR